MPLPSIFRKSTSTTTTTLPSLTSVSSPVPTTTTLSQNAKLPPRVPTGEGAISKIRPTSSSTNANNNEVTNNRVGFAAPPSLKLTRSVSALSVLRASSSGYFAEERNSPMDVENNSNKNVEASNNNQDDEEEMDIIALPLPPYSSRGNNNNLSSLRTNNNSNNNNQSNETNNINNNNVLSPEKSPLNSAKRPRLTPVALECLHICNLRECNRCGSHYTPYAPKCRHPCDLCSRCLGNDLALLIKEGKLKYHCATCQRGLSTQELKAVVELHVRQPEVLAEFKDIVRKRQLLKYFGESRLRRCGSESAILGRKPTPPETASVKVIERPKWNR